LRISRVIGILGVMLGSSCSSTGKAAEPLPKPKVDLPAAKPGEVRTAVFAAGCFWCVESVFEQLEGVRTVVSGYAGGTKETAEYERVSSGATDHAEAVRIEYDERITYGQLLQALFATHDPTTKDRQGPDAGRQYRSAIFFANADEKRVAEAYIKQLEEAKIFSNAIVTTLEPLNGFYEGEKYHQDFVARNPNHPYVRAWVPAKLEKLRSKHGELLKKK
jgi:peptide-methionine (S)-S-oxide reductase